MKHFGGLAFDSLRLEKGFGAWTSLDFSPDYTAVESGLSRFIKIKNSEFIGKDELIRQKEEGPSRRLVMMEVDAGDADAIGNEPVMVGDACIGFATSGGYGHYTKTSVALGYLDSAYCVDGQEVTLKILGEEHSCRVRLQALHDPEGSRMRN